MQVYEQQMTEYTLNMTRYEDELKTFDERVAAGHDRVDELNERFGNWYYVISADNLKSLKTTRADVVSAKEKPADAPVDAGELPPRPNIDFEMPDTNDDSIKKQPGETSPHPPADEGEAEQPAGTDPSQSTDESGVKPPTQVPDDASKGDDG